MKALIEMVVLCALAFQIIYNALCAGIAKNDNESFLLNCVISAGIFLAYLLEVVK